MACRAIGYGRFWYASHKAQVSQLAGPERQESTLAKAKRIVPQELTKMGWTPQDPEVRRKGDPQKVCTGLRLRSKTTVTLSWIAARLRIGAPSHLAYLLYRANCQTTSHEASQDTLF